SSHFTTMVSQFHSAQAMPQCSAVHPLPKNGGVMKKNFFFSVLFVLLSARKNKEEEKFSQFFILQSDQ
ncbi:MAG: hypothetical protein M5F18_10720, partial [Asgard group archaeon]|nr:hypothetical protein [Asgard group archaeon]